MTFFVGQKVVCVAKVAKGWYPDITPDVGEVYTIRDVFDGGIGSEFVRVHEIKNPLRNYSDLGYAECRFTTLAFRPIVERKTDISIFQEILRNTKAPVTDDAFHQSHDMGAR